MKRLVILGFVLLTAASAFAQERRMIQEPARDLERRIEPLVKSGDACGAGSVTLQMQSIGKPIVGARRAAEQKALLTPDQKAKYGTLRVEPGERFER